MGLNWNPVKFFGQRSEQLEMKTVAKKMIEDFTKDLSSLGISEQNNSTPEYFFKINLKDFSEFKAVMSCLHGEVKRISSRFPVALDIKEILKKLEDSSQEIITAIDHSINSNGFATNSMELARKLQIGELKKDESAKIDSELANKIVYNLQELWSNIQKLKNLNFPSILSNKIKTSE